jgi:hypothetical protein
MDEVIFQPDRRFGQVFHLAAILLFVLIAGWGLWQAAQAIMGPVFLLFQVPFLLALGLVPLLVYRLYALRNSQYTLERDGIRIRWGLRVEEIPMTSVLWVHLASELSAPLPLPRLRWPGAVLGMRHLQGAGNVEFMASNARNLVLISTPVRIFAISPANPESFLHTFDRFTEMGSLTPLEARSVYPTFLLTRVWGSRPAMALLLASLLLSLSLLVWVSLTIPSRLQIYLGFKPDGTFGDPVPPVRLLLLPVINTIFVLIDSILGLFFFRREESQPYSYLLWGMGALTPLLFLTAVFFILQAR